MVSTPKAPDPYATAAAQGTINKQTAISQQLLNSMDQTTPDGSLTYSENGSWSDGTPKIGVTQSLSPTNQKLYDTNQGTQINLANIGNQQSGQIGQLLSTPFDMSQGAINGQTAGMPGLPAFRAPGTTYGSESDPYSYTNTRDLRNLQIQAGNLGPNAPNARYTADPTQVASRYTNAPDALTAPDQVQSRYDPNPTQVATRQIGSNDQLENQLYDAAFQRYQPQLDRQRQSTEADLASRGLRPGSTGYDNAMQGVDNAENDLRSQTFLNGQNQAFGQSATRAQNDFSQDLASNNQFFTQWDTKNQHDFGQDLSGSGQAFQQRLGAQGQAFQQELGANGQNFQQDLGAQGQFYGQALQGNQQNYGQDFQNAQYGMGQSQLAFSNAQNVLNAGESAQNTAFTQGMTASQYGSAQDQYSYQAAMAERQQALNELLQNRTEPMNEIASLMGGSQVSRPSWSATPTSTIQPANLEGLVQSNYAQQTSQYNAALGGLAGLGGTAAKGLFSLSDRRVKHDVKQVARLPNGLGVYAYRFADGRSEIGLLAQEVVMLDPSAIMHRDDGLMAVDYARALRAA